MSGADNATRKAAAMHRQLKREAKRAAALRPGFINAMQFPVLADLLRAARDKLFKSRCPDRVRTVRYRGRKYLIEQTIFSRIRVIDPDDGVLLVCGTAFQT